MSQFPTQMTSSGLPSNREHVPIGTPPGYDVNSRPGPSANIRKALRIINATYDAAWAVLFASDSDPHRLHMHANRLILRVLPIVRALEGEIKNLEGGQRWLVNSANRISELVLGLEEAAAARSEEV